MRPVTLAASVLMALVALGHLLRLVFHIGITAAGWPVPMWISVVGVVVPAVLAVGLWREGHR